jgi:hypothetical protein
MDTNGKECSGATFSGSVSATTAATSASSLPTLSPSASSPIYESLGAGLYVQPVFGSASGGGTQVDATHGLPAAVTSQPRAARNFPGCTVGTSSASCLAAATATQFLQVQNASATASIACAFGSSAVLNASGSFQLGPGQSAQWGPMTAGVPTGQLNCIANAASTPLYLEWL